MISFLSFALAVFCYSIKEAYSHNKLKWGIHTDFWGANSWMRKYRFKGDMYHDLPPDNWYYRFFKIKYKERFPLSATLLVAFTDGYHLMQLLFKLLFCISIVTYSMDFNWWMALVYFVIWGITFTITYKILSR